MVSPIPAPTTGPQVPSVNSSAKVAPDAVTAGAIAQTHGGELTTSTTINSLADLKKKSPKMYQKMMESIAMQICREMEDHQSRLKEMMAEANRRS